jgi:electron transfer flavoprotein alpha subunit
MKESERIIAINCDQHSNIFNCADYGIVGDYQEVLSALLQKVRSGFTFGLKS